MMVFSIKRKWYQRYFSVYENGVLHAKFKYEVSAVNYIALKKQQRERWYMNS